MHLNDGTSTGAFSFFDLPGNTYLTVSRINATDQIIGTYSDSAHVNHGFLRSSDGTIVHIDAPGAGTQPGNGTSLNDINSVGIIVGSISTPSGSHSFLRTTGGVFTVFDPPGTGSTGSLASAINSIGTIAGTFYDSTSIPHAYIPHLAGTYEILDHPSASQAPSAGTCASRINEQIIGIFVDAQGSTRAPPTASSANSSSRFLSPRFFTPLRISASSAPPRYSLSSSSFMNSMLFLCGLCGYPASHLASRIAPARKSLAMHRPKIGLLLFFFLPTLSFAQTTTTTPPYLDPSLPIEQRVNDLLSRMTIDEKISQMQDVAPAIPRLDIPAYNWWNEGLHGVARAGIATVFPQAIGLAATWDTALLHKIGDTVSTEARAKYNDAIAHNNTGRYYGLTFWSPNINIFRDPRWGRGQETYGEDPFLTGRLGVAFVTGLQGDDPHYLKTVSTPKHYAVHSGPEPLRHRFDVPVALHDLYDTYTPAFRATVVDGHADSIMCAYNSVDGEPACANRLLFELLRNQWGFKGYVVSDCAAISDLHQAHDFVVTLPQASALAVKAGTDLSCGPEFHALDYALMDRLLTPRDIDRAVGRLFEARFRLGMFDPPTDVSWSKLTLADVDTAANRQLSLQAAHESIVLLKNERHILPLKSSVKSVAVIGPVADSLDVLLGNYNGTPSAYTTFLAGIKKRFASATVSYAIGAPITENRALTVPTEFLRTGGPNSKPGVNAEFFANPTLSGSPTLSRVDPSIDFSAYNVSPGPGVPPENFSVRWTGELVAPVDGDYRIGAITDGGYRLYFDGKLLIDGWVQYRHRGERSLTVLRHLQAGHAYPVKLEYFRSFRESFARLLWIPPNLIQEATAAARNADVVVAVVGITADLEGEERDNSDPGFFGGDRTDITLPTTQQQLLEALAATGKPLIVVLTSGSALAVNWANDHAAAILEAWYPGEGGGTAVADVLSGDYNPSGRLPITFYSSIAQLPPFTDYSMFNRTYRYLRESPLFPFGFGLSYSSFSYSAPVVAQGEQALRGAEGSPSPAAFSGNRTTTVSSTKSASFRAESPHRGIPPDSSGAAPLGFEGAGFDFSLVGRSLSSDETDLAGSGLQPRKAPVSSNNSLPAFPGDSPVTVSARVTNTSNLPGDEVVELYVSHPNIEGAPIRALAGFQRIHLDGHASQTVTFTVTPRELSVVDAQGNRSVSAGPVDLWIGGSQPTQVPNRPAPNGQSAHFNITTSTPVPN